MMKKAKNITNQPTEPGYYWMRDRPGAPWRPVAVEYDYEGVLTARVADHEGVYISPNMQEVWGPRLEPPPDV